MAQLIQYSKKERIFVEVKSTGKGLERTLSKIKPEELIRAGEQMIKGSNTTPGCHYKDMQEEMKKHKADYIEVSQSIKFDIGLYKVTINALTPYSRKR